MNFEEFAQKIQDYYPPDDDVSDDFMSFYFQAINLVGNYNYQNALIDLMRNYKYKKLPSASEVVKSLKNNEIVDNSKKTNKYIEFTSLWAKKGVYWYEFGVEPEIGMLATIKSLSKQGFTNITNQNPRFQNAYNV